MSANAAQRFPYSNSDSCARPNNNTTSFYGSSCANNGRGALNTPRDACVHPNKSNQTTLPNTT
eukprot:1195213-Prorocentrum_minimum.AAC.8